MLNWVPRRVKFEGTEVKSRRQDAGVVSVKLKRRGRSYVGKQRQGESVTDEIRYAAEATLEALRPIVGRDTSLSLKSVGPVAAFGERFVLAVVEVKYEEETHRLMGVCPLSLNPSRDSALAVLDATNRFLGLG